jgi:hypothetical protein
MGAAEVAVLADDLASIVDAECLGGAGKDPRLVKGVEDMDWHVVALLVADRCHQRYHLAVGGRRRWCNDLDRSETNFFWTSSMLFWGPYPRRL